MTLLEAAARWAAADPDDRTRGELEALIARAAGGDAAAHSELADCFDGTLQFGTAGLRGALGPGPNRMNRVVVMRAAAGLGAYLLNQHPNGCAVVIGYDARWNSDVFASDTAAVLAGLGLTPMVLPRPLPTPVLAYAVRALGCAAGVMVTASHNPPQDNGYKVYVGDGCQIVPPVDAQISALIDAAPLDVSLIPRGEDWVTLDESVVRDYIGEVAELVPEDGPRDIRIAYTPMHGVGASVLRSVFERAGFPAPAIVPAQAEPDPAFPTVAFPNPEEPGAMDLVIAEGRRIGADLAIANDPDADRCAVAVPDAGGWRRLTGDEVGSVLGWWCAQRGDGEVLAESIVSSTMLASIAAAAGLRYQATLTGFKWIGRIPGLRFGYEEALGYCVAPAMVGDKDGISAALVVAELAAVLKGQGRTLLDVLDDLAKAHGVHATAQVSIRYAEVARIPEVMGALDAGAAFPDAERIDDLATGVDGLPPTEGVRIALRDGSRVIIRPSGTEPKIKCYLQAVVPVGPGGLAEARAQAAARIATLDAAARQLLA